MIPFLLFKAHVTYEAPQTTGWCAINSQGNKHQHCKCENTNEDIMMCKERCDTDDNCKGYTYREHLTTCYVYTVASCPIKHPGCTMHMHEKFGGLEQHDDSGSEESGCYIKDPSFVHGNQGSEYQKSISKNSLDVY